MKKILTLQLGHNATAGLSENGEIRGVLSQEKCDNIKNSDAFPVMAIQALLKEVGWSVKDIDHIVIAGLYVFAPGSYQYTQDNKNRLQAKSRLINMVRHLRNGWIGRVCPAFFQWLTQKRREALAQKGKVYLQQELDAIGLGNKPIEFVEHHLCHARSAYYSFTPSSAPQAGLIFTLDGAGDNSCATVTHVKEDGTWHVLGVTPLRASLGYIYSNTTRFLGMKVLEHEYKVMGLAPYAKDKYVKDTYERLFKPTIWLSKENPLVFESAFDTSKFYDYLADHAVGQRFDNIAGAVQQLTEELVVEWIRRAIQMTGVKRIYTGGGVFMNVKMNKRIQEMTDVEEVHFMPSCGDESNPIGAAYDFAIRNNIPTQPLKDIYLGIHFSDDEIEAYIQKNKIDQKYNVTKPIDIETAIVDLLVNKEVVARFAGRCEWGARSLGNRAILAHPSHMESFYMVNDFIKSRDFWMPFAPSMLDSSAPAYLVQYQPTKVQAPYMITAFAATERGVRDLRAALHQGDHTLRPQVVTQDMNSSYHRLIQLFEQRTGVGAVLNTSFNLHGYPLVATPEQAMMTLENSGLKHLVLGSYLVSKAA